MLQLVQGRRQMADTQKSWDRSVNRAKLASSGVRGGKAGEQTFALHSAVYQAGWFSTSPLNCRNLTLLCTRLNDAEFTEAILPTPCAKSSRKCVSCK